jgi:hypothetical protein
VYRLQSDAFASFAVTNTTRTIPMNDAPPQPTPAAAWAVRRVSDGWQLPLVPATVQDYDGLGTVRVFCELAGDPDNHWAICAGLNMHRVHSFCGGGIVTSFQAGVRSCDDRSLRSPESLLGEDWKDRVRGYLMPQSEDRRIFWDFGRQNHIDCAIAVAAASVWAQAVARAARCRFGSLTAFDRVDGRTTKLIEWGCRRVTRHPMAWLDAQAAHTIGKNGKSEFWGYGGDTPLLRMEAFHTGRLRKVGTMQNPNSGNEVHHLIVPVSRDYSTVAFAQMSDIRRPDMPPPHRHVAGSDLFYNA